MSGVIGHTKRLIEAIAKHGPVKPRRPYDDDHPPPNGYLEGDRDFLENNNDLAVALLEALTDDPKTLEKSV